MPVLGCTTSTPCHPHSPGCWYHASDCRLEWNNFLERMGVDSEEEAWRATRDGYGNPCSGELEVRMWASRRGQTLARTVTGVLEYARAVQLLAQMQVRGRVCVQWARHGCVCASPAATTHTSTPPLAWRPPLTVQIEMEYALIENYEQEQAVYDGVERQPKTPEQLSEEAESAALWFAEKRVAYVVACQRYAEIGPEEQKKARHVDVLLFMNPT